VKEKVAESGTNFRKKNMVTSCSTWKKCPYQVGKTWFFIFFCRF